MQAARAPMLGAELLALAPIDPAAVPIEDARRVWMDYRRAAGMVTAAPFTMPGVSNVKVSKGAIPTRLLTLSPADASGAWNTCPRAGACKALCVLATAGKGVLQSVRAARALRTRFLGEHPHSAVALIAAEVAADARRAGGVLVRLNVASDIPWERVAPALLAIPGARFYDYTKLHPATRASVPGYRVVYSVSEAPGSIERATQYMSAGGTAAVVFATRKGHPLPVEWHGFPVIDGDLSDDRTADPAGVVVGLRAKGAARGLPADGGFLHPGA